VQSEGPIIKSSAAVNTSMRTCNSRIAEYDNTAITDPNHIKHVLSNNKGHLAVHQIKYVFTSFFPQ
jgi:seryl-tRNA(Sec) selenium transferase